MESVTGKKWAILNLVAFLAVVAVNTLAVVLPINGMDTGRISDLYPNLFVPAGFTFSIWSVIYLLLLLFCIYGLSVSSAVIKSIAPLFIISCLLNMGWIMLWHYLLIGPSVLVMILFLVILISIYLKLRSFSPDLSAKEKVAVRLPFSVYLGWICVATIANITAFAVHTGWTGFGIDPSLWSAIMIFIAAVLGILFLKNWQDIPYAFVIIWALFGIYSKQLEASKLVGYTALGGIGVLGLGILFVAIRSLQVKNART